MTEIHTHFIYLTEISFSPPILIPDDVRVFKLGVSQWGRYRVQEIAKSPFIKNSTPLAFLQVSNEDYRIASKDAYSIESYLKRIFSGKAIFGREWMSLSLDDVNFIRTHFVGLQSASPNLYKFIEP